ncbi:MAG: CZB domain-containing protein [SAR324 cluster bacterium]|nr:CZB domain-containing protein [SAR324 cluster bacterium]
MDFTEAIAAHSQWKVKLRMYLENNQGDYTVEEVACDDKCSLGKWIYGDGVAYKNAPAYEPLRNVHADFHVSTSKIIGQIQEGKKDEAKAALESGSPYVDLSLQTIVQIRELREYIEEQGE